VNRVDQEDFRRTLNNRIKQNEQVSGYYAALMNLDLFAMETSNENKAAQHKL